MTALNDVICLRFLRAAWNIQALPGRCECEQWTVTSRLGGWWFVLEWLRWHTVRAWRARYDCGCPIVMATVFSSATLTQPANERLMIQYVIYWSCVTCNPNAFRTLNNYTTYKNICWSRGKVVNVLVKLRSAGSNMFWRRPSLNSWASTRRRPRLEILSPRLHNLVVLTPEAWHDDNSAKLRYNSDRFTWSIAIAKVRRLNMRQFILPTENAS